MNFNALDKSIACIIGFYSLFLWFFGVYVTIFNSPDIDMGVFYERFADPNFLPNDFYTMLSQLLIHVLYLGILLDI